jgi:membrane-associated phospholipid phosphatase
MEIARAITEFGEPTLLVPLSGILCAVMALRSRAWALRWTQAFVLCAIGITALKLCFLACPQKSLWLRSPSGHAAISFLFFPSLAWLAVADGKPWLRGLLIGLGVVAATAVALTRVVLLAHSWSEVAAGAAVGLGSFAFFMRGERHSNEEPSAGYGQRSWLLMVGLLAVTWGLYGEKLPFEAALQAAARNLQVGLPACR